MFRAIFRSVRLRFLQHMVSCCCGRQGFGERQRGTTSATLPLSEPLPTTTTGYNMLYISQSYAPEDGQKIDRTC